MEKLCLVDKCLEAAVTGSKNDMFQFTQGQSKENTGMSENKIGHSEQKITCVGCISTKTKQKDSSQ